MPSLVSVSRPKKKFAKKIAAATERTPSAKVADLVFHFDTDKAATDADLQETLAAVKITPSKKAVFAVVDNTLVALDVPLAKVEAVIAGVQAAAEAASDRAAAREAEKEEEAQALADRDRQVDEVIKKLGLES